MVEQQDRDDFTLTEEENRALMEHVLLEAATFLDAQAGEGIGVTFNLASGKEFTIFADDVVMKLATAFDLAMGEQELAFRLAVKEALPRIASTTALQAEVETLREATGRMWEVLTYVAKASDCNLSRDAAAEAMGEVEPVLFRSQP